MEVERHGVREDVSRNVARTVWALLLIWTGLAMLLRWSWGVGLVGAGAILLVAQAARALLAVKIDGFGLVAGVLLVLCGAWNLFGVGLELFPLLCIGAGVALLASMLTRSGRRAPHGGEAHAHSPPQP